MFVLNTPFFNAPDNIPFVSLKDLVIITPYNGQMKLYEAEMLNVATRLGCNYEDLPECVSLDSYQSRDSRFVILDTVIDSTKEASDVGFLSI